MIDFSKAKITDKMEFDYRIQEKGNIQLSSRYNIQTGELMDYPKSGKFYNQDLHITEQTTSVKGSLHKLYNKRKDLGEQNFSDFHMHQVWEILEDMCGELEINPEFTSLTNLEFGLNIQLDFDPQIFIDRNLIMYSFENYSRNEKFGGKGDFKEFKKSDYSLKIYNKGKHYQILKPPKNLLRVEVKITKSRVLQKLGIFSYQDLFNPNSYLKLMEFLMKRFNKLMIIDTEDIETAFREGDPTEIREYINPNYWLDLKDKHLGNKDKLYKQRKKCLQKISQAGMDKTKKIIEDLLWDKFDELTSSYKSSIYKVA